MRTANKEAYVAGLSKVEKVLEDLQRDLDPGCSLQAALSFIRAAREEAREGPADSGEIARDLGISSAQMSRVYGVLSKWRRAASGGGYDVVDLKIDPTDRRRRRVYLTPKGKQLASRVARAVD